MLAGMNLLAYGFADKDRKALERSAAALGHRLLAESDLAAAVARAADSDVAVVVADGRLPRFEWLDLCRQLRSNPGLGGIYVLLLSSPEADESHEAWAVESGVDDFLFRLDDARELARRLRPAFKVSRAARRARQLEATLSICSYCKRVRDELDHWRDIDAYIGTRLRGQLTPVICPDCYLKHFGPEFRAGKPECVPARGAAPAVQPPM